MTGAVRLAGVQLLFCPGVTFQQVQKYERGSNRISSSRLFEFAKVLDVAVSHFFDEMTPEPAKGKRKVGRPKTKASGETDINTKRETLGRLTRVSDSLCASDPWRVDRQRIVVGKRSGKKMVNCA
jgi:transcriptional regulator with XRE-family HTH domain